MIAGVGMPERIEQVVWAPVEEEGHQSPADEDKSQEKSSDESAIHFAGLSSQVIY
jgi:hypothetical protein